MSRDTSQPENFTNKLIKAAESSNPKFTLTTLTNKHLLTDIGGEHSPLNAKKDSQLKKKLNVFRLEFTKPQDKLNNESFVIHLARKLKEQGSTWTTAMAMLLFISGPDALDCAENGNQKTVLDFIKESGSVGSVLAELNRHLKENNEAQTSSWDKRWERPVISQPTPFNFVASDSPIITQPVVEPMDTLNATTGVTLPPSIVPTPP